MLQNMKFLAFFLFGVLWCTFFLSAQEKTEFTVAQDGSGDFTSVQAAVDACKAFPDQRVIIHLKNGIYHEKVKIPACNTRLSILGENAEKTIITWDDYFSKINRGRNSTFYTYTMMVEADDFYMENVTVENSAGPVGQAVALHVEGDRCSFRNCRILGNQDTLYTAGQNSRQYFNQCYVEGTTDFIFGAATVVFDECTIFSKGDSYVTAASTPQGKPFGYVFLHCQLTSAAGVTKVFLGRPWRDYAKTVFLNCEMGAHIVPAGWSNWSGTSRDKTVFYAEFENTGPGANPAAREPWSHQLTQKQASRYSVSNILKLVGPERPDDQEWISPDKVTSAKNILH
jgi:pectinesterase